MEVIYKNTYPNGKTTSASDFFRPILEVLIESGGSGTPSKIVDRSMKLSINC